MTIDVFWQRIESAIMDYGECDVCPVNEYAEETKTVRMCDKVCDCADGLMMLHKMLESEERQKMEHEMKQVVTPSDTEFDFKRGYAQSKTDLSLQMIKELDELETPNDYSSDWTNGYNAGVSRMTKIFIKLMKGVKYDGE